MTIAQINTNYSINESIVNYTKTLPTEILTHIFSGLENKSDIAKSCRVNRQWNGLTSANAVWKPLYQKIPLDDQKPPPEGKNFKEHLKDYHAELDEKERIRKAEVRKNRVILGKLIGQKSLLGLTVVCAILATIPPLRLVGSLALRSLSLLSSGVNCVNAWKQEGILGRISKIAKVAIVGLGLGALIVASPLLIVASIAGDLGLQIFETAKAIYNKDVEKALCHASFIVIDTLVLAAIVVGSWQLIVTAAAVSATVMFGFATKSFLMFDKKTTTREKASDIFDSLCYFSLMSLGIVNAITTAHIKENQATKASYEIKNNKKTEMVFYDRKGHVVARAKPGETVSFELKGDEMEYRDATIFGYYGKCERQAYDPIHADFEDVVIQNAIPVSEIPLVPLGGNQIVTEDFS